MYMAKIGQLGDLLVSVRQKIRKVISNVFRLNIEMLKKGRGMEVDRFSYQNNRKMIKLEKQRAGSTTGNTSEVCEALLGGEQRRHCLWRARYC